jgi:hypothetical protein
MLHSGIAHVFDEPDTRPLTELRRAYVDSLSAGAAVQLMADDADLRAAVSRWISLALKSSTEPGDDEIGDLMKRIRDRMWAELRGQGDLVATADPAPAA